MPRRDRTGPFSFGPATGKGLGWCGSAGIKPGQRAKYGGSGAVNGGYGRRCRLHGDDFSAGGRNQRTPTALYGPGAFDDELDYLEDYASGLEESLNAIKERITKIRSNRGTPASE